VRVFERLAGKPVEDAGPAPDRSVSRCRRRAQRSLSAERHRNFSPLVEGDITRRSDDVSDDDV
jgi:hypothetical protein